MKLSRRESIKLSATALAGVSLGMVGEAAAQAPWQSEPKPVEPPRQSPAERPRDMAAAAAAPDRLTDSQLRNIPALPLRPDGSAPEHSAQDAGQITGVLWRTRNQTPEIEFDYRKLEVKLDPRGTAKLSGTLTFGNLEKLPRHTQVTLLQCGAPTPRGIVKWTGVRFSDFAKSLDVQPFAAYARFVGSDGYYVDEDIKTLMHPQVMLAWMMNDAPLPPQHGAPLRLVIPFRYGGRSLKAIREITFTATTFAPQKPWAT
jgi:DMSO/TMAO reductase YedYZ molybdopterin-dependent catalytic subunit